MMVSTGKLTAESLSEKSFTGHELQVVVIDFRPTHDDLPRPGHELQVVAVDFQPTVRLKVRNHALKRMA
jgi:hypothetical protein